MSKLYPHNQKVYNSVIEYFEHTNKVAVVQATGTGKGFLASEFINGPFKGKNILILAPNADILINYRKNFGISSSDNITLMLYQSLLPLYNKQTVSNDKYKSFEEYCNTVDFLIIDEFHRVGAPKWGDAISTLMNCLDKRNKKILGLSATPIRYNDKSILKNELIPIEERRKLAKVRNMVDQIFEGNIIQGISLEEAIFAGILPEFKYILANYGYETEITNAVEKLNDTRELYGSTNSAVRKLERYVSELLSLGSERDNLRKVITDETSRLGKNQKWIIFCSSKEQLENLDIDLGYWFNKDLNIFSKTQIIDKSKLNLYCVVSGEDVKQNESNLNNFYNNTEGLHIIKCINKLNEGVHVKDVTGIIMLRQTLSPIVYLQQIGRALSAGNSHNPIIFDFMNNIELMRQVNEGQDEYVNSILKSQEILRKYCNGDIQSEFLQSLGIYKGQKKSEPRIVIKNKSLSMLNLFNNIQDILNVGSSVLWKEVELNILKKYYELGGAKAVYNELQHKHISTRTLDAIDAKAKEYNLKFNIRKGEVKINTDNTLEWLPEEDDLVLNYFNCCKHMKPLDIAIRLHLSHLPNRKPEAIYNHYQYLSKGHKKPIERLSRDGLRWTDNEKYMLKKNVELNIPLEFICWELERSPSAVRSQIKRMGLKSNGVKIEYWTKEEEDWLFENYDKLTLAELSEKLGRNKSSLSKKYKRLFEERYYDKRKANYSYLKGGQNWTEVEERLLLNSWGDDWDIICNKITTKTPKQIKEKILKECKKDGSPNPYHNDIKFKEVS